MDALSDWHDFHVAMVGATAALAGLVIVAASVNIGDIVKSPTLTARLGSGIVMLVAALIASSVALMPGVSDIIFGVIVLVVAVAALSFQTTTARLLASDQNSRDQARVAKAAVGFLSPLTYGAGGVLLLLDQSGGLYFVAAGTMLAIVSALIVSWVALVEVLR